MSEQTSWITDCTGQTVPLNCPHQVQPPQQQQLQCASNKEENQATGKKDLLVPLKRMHKTMRKAKVVVARVRLNENIS